jgi:hypothetical protein
MVVRSIHSIFTSLAERSHDDDDDDDDDDLN